MTPCIQTCEDRQLLEAYAQTRSDQAFREIVHRHGKWVFAVAYRQLGDLQLAQDAAQVVFILLANRADTMRTELKVSGWLFKAVNYTVKNMKRELQRRMMHEQRAAALRPEAGTASGQASDGEWGPRLDGAVSRLSKMHRSAILLRFYQERSFHEIAGILGISEEAAQKRVNRAVECLRQRMGVRADAAALSALTAFGAGLAPPNLTHHLANMALAAKAGAALPVSIAASAKGTGWLMVVTKLQSAALVAGVSLLVTVPATLATAHYLARGSVTPAHLAAFNSFAADAQSDADMAAFNQIYALKAGEFVKRVAPPFNDARAAGYEQLAQLDRDRRTAALQAQRDAAAAAGEPVANAGSQTFTISGGGGGMSFTGGGGGGGGFGGGGGGGGGMGPGMPFNMMGGMPAGAGQWGMTTPGMAPAAMILGWQENKPAEFIARHFGAGADFPVSELLVNSFSVDYDALDGEIRLLRREIPGDFVQRAGATDEQLRTGYEKIFSAALATPISLKLADVDEKVIVFRGKWAYKPVDPNEPEGVPNIHIYSADMTSNSGGGSGSGSGSAKQPNFFQPLMREVKMPLLMEAEGVPPAMSYTLHDKPGQQLDIKALLDHVSEQTGLKWTQETRKVRHVSIEPARPQ